MEAQRRTAGLSEGGRPAKTGLSKNPVITLAEIGIDKNLAKQARKLAALPEEKFEALVKRHAEAAHFWAFGEHRYGDRKALVDWGMEGGKGLSKRQAAKVLGVDESTIRDDLRGNPAPRSQPSPLFPLARSSNLVDVDKVCPSTTTAKSRHFRPPSRTSSSIGPRLRAYPS